jgi:hypothetical protein
VQSALHYGVGTSAPAMGDHDRDSECARGRAAGHPEPGTRTPYGHGLLVAVETTRSAVEFVRLRAGRRRKQ